MLTHNATHNETSDHNRVNEGLLYLIATFDLWDPGPPHYRRAPRLGPRAFSVGAVNLLNSNFVCHH